MIKDNPELLKWLDTTLKLFDDNDIWYSAEASPLLEAVSGNELTMSSDNINLMITLESFEKIKQLFPKNIITTDDCGYPFIYPRFIFDKDNISTSQIFINLFILIPTTKNKINIFGRSSNRYKYNYQTLVGEKIKSKSNLIFKTYILFLSLFNKPSKLQQARVIDELWEKENPSTLLLLSSVVETGEGNQYPLDTISTKLITKQFNGINIKIIKNFNETH